MDLKLEYARSAEKHSNIWKEVQNIMPRLHEKYEKEVVPALMEKFAYKNIMEVPKLEKIVINMGVGEAKDNPKVLEAAVADLQLITDRKSVV